MLPRNFDTSALQARDAAHYIHPFTDHARLHAKGSRVVVRGEGVYVWDSDGNRLIDGLAGLGCVNIGYGREELVTVAAAQMRDLSYCPSFFGTTHPAVVGLAGELAAILPQPLNHAFFQSSGSEANETAVRLVRKYWELVGQKQRHIIIAREAAYHGSTVMAASLSGIPPMHTAGWDVPLAGIDRIRAPYRYHHGRDMEEESFGILAAGWLEEKILELGPENVAAFFAEPAQSAGGAICPPMSYWPEIQRICKKYDILLVADEVVCGFGRTGEWFGGEYYGFVPDVMQVGKGLTSGYLPLSACVMSDRIANILIGRGGEWAHGFTYSGHPACCAVALENIRILREERIVERARRDLVPRFAEGLRRFADHPLVGDVRSVGLMGGLELVRNKATAEAWPEEARIGEACANEALRRGLALRANGDTMSLMPPLIITTEQLDTVFAIVAETLDATARQFGVMR